MNIVYKNNITWFLEDDALETVIDNISHATTDRRTYRIYDFQSGKVFIKTFIEKGLFGFLKNRFFPRARKEYELAYKLQACSILTPKPLGFGLERACSYIIEEWIEGESLINVFLKQRAGEQGGREADATRKELFDKLATLLKTLKSHCIRHNDLHLDNILIHNNRLYLIDLHKMRIKKHFTFEDEMSNLSHALAMVYSDMEDHEKEAFFQSYGMVGIRMDLEKEIQKLRDRWVKKKEQRAFTDTSRIVSDGEYVHMVGMEKYGKGEFIELIKEDKKVKLERFSDHVRKVYRNKRRLKKAWRVHVVLAYMNLPIIPEAYCLKIPPFFGEGYVAMEDLKGKGIELDRYLDGEYDGMGEKERRDFSSVLSKFLISVFEKGIIHKDLKGCNVFVLKNGGCIFLDVEDIVFKDIKAEDLKRMLVQLNNTIPGRIRIRDRMRFFLKLSAFVKADRKQIFKDVVRESFKGEIVYEGVGGLNVESW
jgi:tRNA A-37 threonylcarbamoyl transferase component Bud32